MLKDLSLIIFALFIVIAWYAAPFDLGGNIADKPIETPKIINLAGDPISALQKDKNLNDEIDAFIVSFDAKQENYIQQNGKYFQGSDKADKVPGLTKGWTDISVDKAILPFNVRVNEYVAPGNIKGWQAYFYVFVGEDRYSKSIGKGPNANQYSYDWRQDEKPY